MNDKRLKDIEKNFEALPISKSDWIQVTGENVNSDLNIDSIIDKWNQHNKEEGKYLITTADFGIEFGLEKHMLKETPIAYEILKSDMEQHWKNRQSPFIKNFYIIEDLNANQSKIKNYENYKEAFTEYIKLPDDKCKAFGITNNMGYPLDLVQCKAGMNTLIRNFEKTPGWDNNEVREIVATVAKDLREFEKRASLQDFMQKIEQMQNVENIEIEDLEPEI